MSDIENKSIDQIINEIIYPCASCDELRDKIKILANGLYKTMEVLEGDQACHCGDSIRTAVSTFEELGLLTYDEYGRRVWNHIIEGDFDNRG